MAHNAVEVSGTPRFEFNEAFEKRLALVEDRLRLLENIDDRVTDHDRELDAIRSQLRLFKRELSLCRADISRMSEGMANQTLILGRVHSLLEQLVTQQTPSVVVTP